MTTPESDTLQTTAWYYKRQLFSSGSPGVLSLADGRLNFVITKNNEIAFDVPLALRQAQGQVKDADRTCTTQVTYHWIRVAMSVTYNDRRHLVSFVGDRSASQAADASPRAGLSPVCLPSGSGVTS